METNTVIKEIEFLNVFPSKKYKGYNSVVVFFRDNFNHPYILYAEKVEQSCYIEIIDTITEAATYLLHRAESELKVKIMPDDQKALFRLIDLDENPVKITKKAIEEKLGYKIQIV